MEFLFVALVIGVVIFIAKGVGGGQKPLPPPRKRTIAPLYRPARNTRRSTGRTATTPIKKPTRPRADMPVIEGPAYVIDGDSLRIQKTEIRIYGVDAPELNHPFGQKAKWAMVKLCKGHKVRAKIIEQDTHGRAVALCYLPDGRDLSEEMVKLGLALDWPKYSEGDYRMFEPEGVRKKLWLADARQKGRMHVWAQFDARQKAKAANQAK